MKGLILDYNHSEAFILLEDDSVSTVPINSVHTLLTIGSNARMRLYEMPERSITWR